ncbi:predicted protein [Phaeodactylum tricornutum CCAP 1055/1]|jgi:selT/selW/selH-like putative selenoprotein|uniref:Uncharacterized protein n=1 Tax=Phaeodactylum tricornutum (strain CCAP 1055/1) TaxID=556484 RepID=B7G6P7_PHATC|nr:predicted protein [Phaeodactylum tricornutum CCAP 1055/1]EEC45630.1 predicted protein [Phaeodactylum tricornutum CCAP 1055/1]|mmetsp:Transcript_35102/g.91896  ORF Transcript_35102/g.91896 Transcript_35102/m.91896 type:complete len:144 (-) Transcript_35102:246-677(-)|eukprot:XP_002182894.1 predicted protein [Phaeodactylum tricornutum CCAP 1055/1]
MKRNFLNVQKFLEDQFPELRGHITGANYPPPATIELAANLMSVIQLMGIFWIVAGGEKIFRFLGYPQNQLPSVYHTINQNAMPIGIFLFLILPQWIGRYTQTGAFEVYLNDKEIFSKLSKGAFPTADDLISSLVQAGLQTAQD